MGANLTVYGIETIDSHSKQGLVNSASRSSVGLLQYLLDQSCKVLVLVHRDIQRTGQVERDQSKSVLGDVEVSEPGQLGDVLQG